MALCLAAVFSASLFYGSLGAETQYVSCKTTKGDIGLEIYNEWAPRGATRFIELVKDGFFTDIGLFRCVKKFLTQFGISDKKQYKHWHRETIKDDPNLNLGIKKYYISYAGGGPNTRSTQLFIAFEDQDFLGKAPWETPFGKVIRGTESVDRWYTGYGEITPFKKDGVDQQQIYSKGNQYLRDNFPLIDYILSCEITDEDFSASAAKMEHSGSTNTVQMLPPEDNMVIGSLDAGNIVDHNTKPEGLSKEHAAVDHEELAHNHNEVPQGVNEGIEELSPPIVKHNQLPEGIAQSADSVEQESDQLAAELNQVQDAERLKQEEEQKVPEETAAATPKHLLHVAGEVAAATLSDPRAPDSADDNAYPSPQATGKSDDGIDTSFEESQHEELLRRDGLDSQGLEQHKLDQVLLSDPITPKIAESPTDSVSFNRYLRMARYTLNKEAPLLYSYRFLFLTCLAVSAFLFYFAYGIHSTHRQIARSKKY